VVGGAEGAGRAALAPPEAAGGGGHELLPHQLRLHAQQLLRHQQQLLISLIILLPGKAGSGISCRFSIIQQALPLMD
jgi:hypothetical protein